MDEKANHHDVHCGARTSRVNQSPFTINPVVHPNMGNLSVSLLSLLPTAKQLRYLLDPIPNEERKVRRLKCASNK